MSHAAPAADARIERLLAAPILPTLLRLSAPGALLVVFQSMISIGDTWFVSRLGTVPLAGLALVFPLLMLLQMTSAGAMGGGVASAIARALGAGDLVTVRRLVVHSLAIALALGVAFTLLLRGFGRPVYRLLGAQEATIGFALAYSNVVFGGAILVWLANTLASALRGTGNMLLPALTLSAATLVHVPLSGSLVLGWGPLPQLGIAGPSDCRRSRCRSRCSAAAACCGRAPATSASSDDCSGKSCGWAGSPLPRRRKRCSRRWC